MSAVTVTPARRLRGRVRLPGDKSISHRYALLAALASGRSSIAHYAPGADCQATLACLRALGVTVSAGAAGEPAAVQIEGRGGHGLLAPPGPLDAQNSGTTLRLLAGVLAGHPFESILTGDASLCRRPMRRVVEPLERMGARIASSGGCPPLTIQGAALRGIEYATPVPSAQVKSAILLAGLLAEGRTTVREAVLTRDHTERALAAFGVIVRRDGLAVSVDGGAALTGCALHVPGDLSSAAYWAVAAAALPGSDIELTEVGLNPTRTALLEVLRRGGADVDAVPGEETAGEPRGSIRVRPGTLRRLDLGPEEVPGLIDELPVLAAMATHGGEISVRGASELRVKESDRIAALIRGLRALGAEADEWPDGFQIGGRRRLEGGTADAAGDHRLAMAFAIAALGARGPTTITGADAVAVSYPGFFEVLAELAR